MQGIKAAEPAFTSVINSRINQGTVKIVTQTVQVKSHDRTDLINLTDELRAFIASTNISDGHLLVSSLHTTAGLFVNEWQDALLEDIKALFDRMVPRADYYRHNDPMFSDCDRKNADSHLMNTIIGHSLLIPILDGNLVLGQWQRIIFAEFDGPNQRNIFLQAQGI